MFTIPLNALIRINEKKHVNSEEESYPLLWFEDGEGIHLYLPTGYAIYHAIFKEGDIALIGEDQRLLKDDFKMSYLRGAIQLLEKPKHKSMTIAINDETHTTEY